MKIPTKKTPLNKVYNPICDMVQGYYFTSMLEGFYSLTYQNCMIKQFHMTLQISNIKNVEKINMISLNNIYLS